MFLLCSSFIPETAQIWWNWQTRFVLTLWFNLIGAWGLEGKCNWLTNFSFFGVYFFSFLPLEFKSDSKTGDLQHHAGKFHCNGYNSLKRGQIKLSVKKLLLWGEKNPNKTTRKTKTSKQNRLKPTQTLWWAVSVMCSPICHSHITTFPRYPAEWHYSGKDSNVYWLCWKSVRLS